MMFENRVLRRIFWTQEGGTYHCGKKLTCYEIPENVSVFDIVWKITGVI
jgi:hypothetical protein